MAGNRKITDAERHKRFLAMAKEVGASDSPKVFDRAFDKVVKPAKEAKAIRRP